MMMKSKKLGGPERFWEEICHMDYHSQQRLRYANLSAKRMYSETEEEKCPDEEERSHVAQEEEDSTLRRSERWSTTRERKSVTAKKLIAIKYE